MSTWWKEREKSDCSQQRETFFSFFCPPLQVYVNFTDICSFLEKSLFLQQLRPLTNPQQFQASVKYNVRIDRVKACGRGKGAVSLARSSLSLSSIGSMRLYRSCGNAFNSYSNGFITGDIFLQNDSPPSSLRPTLPLPILIPARIPIMRFRQNSIFSPSHLNVWNVESGLGFTLCTRPPGDGRGGERRSF